ncbi:SulP family inorganic anion transporter, partial [Streptomyces sp. SID8455]|nr:SulP family inorganic anion transporter [Streptomyces sp. SID8455]
MADTEQPGTALAKIAGLPGLAAEIATNTEALTAFGLGAGTVAVLLLWPKLPAAVRLVPAPLAAVGLATAVAALAGLSPAVADVNGLLHA